MATKLWETETQDNGTVTQWCYLRKAKHQLSLHCRIFWTWRLQKLWRGRAERG